MVYMVSGYNPYQIAEVLDMDIRSIYAYKQRIEKRMGGKINELFIRFTFGPTLILNDQPESYSVYTGIY